MRKEKSRSPPKLSNGRLLLILACVSVKYHFRSYKYTVYEKHRLYLF